jgi:catechol 2,3-dioxygenase-like lactoylglutathione lyase family enzyme
MLVEVILQSELLNQGGGRMGFISTILVVEDVLDSRKLYEDILGMKVTGDFGICNVGFEGGLSLYRRAFFEELTGRKVEAGKHHNLAVYFEIDNLEGMEEKIAQEGLEFIHRIGEQPWKQRTFRCYDRDGHVLEIAERMDATIRRLFEAGNPLEEIARVTGYTVEQVKVELEKGK